VQRAEKNALLVRAVPAEHPVCEDRSPVAVATWHDSSDARTTLTNAPDDRARASPSSSVLGFGDRAGPGLGAGAAARYDVEQAAPK